MRGQVVRKRMEERINERFAILKYCKIFFSLTFQASIPPNCRWSLRLWAILSRVCEKFQRTRMPSIRHQRHTPLYARRRHEQRWKGRRKTQRISEWVSERKRGGGRREWKRKGEKKKPVINERDKLRHIHILKHVHVQASGEAKNERTKTRENEDKKKVAIQNCHGWRRSFRRERNRERSIGDSDDEFRERKHEWWRKLMKRWSRISIAITSCNYSILPRHSHGAKQTNNNTPLTSVDRRTDVGASTIHLSLPALPSIVPRNTADKCIF